MSRWYELKGQEMAAEVANIAECLWRDQSTRRSRYLRNLQLFEVLGITTADSGGYYTATHRNSDTDALGLLRSGVQTAAAEVFAKQKPKPQFMTSGADWKKRRRAKKTDKICEGILHQRQGRWLDVWQLVFDAGVECLVQGSAALYVLGNEQRKRLEHDLVPVSQLYVDPNEARDPSNLFRQSPIDQDKAIALFCHESGDKEGNERRKRAIEGAGAFEDTSSVNQQQGKPRAVKAVKMIQAWRLPFSPDKPGKACVAIGGQIMAEEDWTAPAFPFVFLHWEPWRHGFWGSGLIDEGLRQSEDANDLMTRLLTRAKVCGGNRLYAREDSITNKEALEENGPETVIWYTGDAAPVEALAQPFSPAEVEMAQIRIKSFWDAIGVSQVSAAARREPGVESAVAMRTLNDTKAGRQLPKAQMFEKVFVDLGLQYVYRLRELASENGGKFSIKWAGKRALNEIDWSEADPGNDDDFAVTVAPASALPNDPAGRLSMAGELYASKLIDGPTYKQLLGWPDLEQETDVQSAEYEYIDFLIDKYLDADEKDWDASDYESPEGAIMDKSRALLRFTAAMFQAKRDGAPEFNVALLRRYIKELGAQISAAQQAQTPGQSPEQSPPGTQAPLRRDPTQPMPAQAAMPMRAA